MNTIKQEHLDYIRKNAYFLQIGCMKLDHNYTKMRSLLGENINYYMVVNKSDFKTIGTLTTGNKTKDLFNVFYTSLKGGRPNLVATLTKSVTVKDMSRTLYEIKLK